MGVPVDKDVHVHRPGQCIQGLEIAIRNTLMTVDDADA